MRRTTAAIAATSALALVGGAVIALPTGAASAAVVSPKLVSLKVSPSSVTTVPALNSSRKITVTAVYNDPDDVLRNVGFSNNGDRIQNYSPKDFSPVESGSRRTFTGVFDADYNDKPGVVRVYVEGQVGYGDLVPGTIGRTSYVVKNKPLLSIQGTSGIDYIWGKKAKLYGNLTSTPNNVNKKVKIQFKAKGKKWKNRGTARTGERGLYFTKKYKINKVGTWRVKYAGAKYVLPTKATWKVKNPYRS